MRVVRGFPAMVVAFVALVVALGGIAVGHGGSGGVGENGVIRSCLAQDGSLRVIRTGESCHSGARLLLLRAAGGPVTENSPVAFASRTGKPRPIIRNRWTPVTSNAVAKGSYAVNGAVRIDHHGRLDRDARIRCGLRLPNGRLIPASVVAATFEKGDAGDTVLPISVTIDRMPAGRLTLACNEIARGGRATGAAAAAPGSPGVLSGNIVQTPIHIPVNACGNTVNVIGGLNPGFGNTCVNNK
jgi:ChpA-C